LTHSPSAPQVVASVLTWYTAHIISGSLAERREDCSACIAKSPIWGDRCVSLPVGASRPRSLPKAPANTAILGVWHVRWRQQCCEKVNGNAARGWLAISTGGQRATATWDVRRKSARHRYSPGRTGSSTPGEHCPSGDAGGIFCMPRTGTTRRWSPSSARIHAGRPSANYCLGA
jgi:hypothetical protein